MTSRTHSAIQHVIEYPAGHLDRFASFGPAFEMSTAGDGHDRPVAQPAQPAAPITQPAQITEMSNDFDAKRFIIAGKATFTLQGLKARYTYRATVSDPDDQGKTVVFCALLTGPDNQSDYTYLGLIDGATGAVRLTRKSRYTDGSQPVVALRWALARIWAGRPIDPARIYHEGRCGRCGRALTVPASITSGFGPECLGQLGG